MNARESADYVRALVDEGQARVVYHDEEIMPVARARAVYREIDVGKLLTGKEGECASVLARIDMLGLEGSRNLRGI